MTAEEMAAASATVAVAATVTEALPSEQRVATTTPATPVAPTTLPVPGPALGPTVREELAPTTLPVPGPAGGRTVGAEPPPATRPSGAAVYPRSPRKRLLAQQAAPVGGVRSQPFAWPVAAPRVEPPPLPDPILPLGPWHWRRPVFVLAIIAWLVAVALLATTLVPIVGGAPYGRRLLLGAWAVASLLTFGPLQWRLGLSGLAWQGIFGWTLLAALLAYAPPPTHNLLSLPDVPVYLLFFLAVFYAAASATTPLTFLLGRLVLRDRLQRLDTRRARRQGYEAGLLLVAILSLSGLRVLTWWTGLLLIVVVVLLETLFLSQVPPEG